MIVFAFIGALLTFWGGAFVLVWFIAEIVSGKTESVEEEYVLAYSVVLFLFIFFAVVAIFSFHLDPESYGYMKIPTETVEEVTK